jgi:NAD(P)H-hydrate epimerase
MFLSRDQLREIDRRAVEEYHIPSIVLMENASRSALEIALQMVQEPAGKPILVICGGGNNGGDGLAVARHLANRHATVQIALTIDPAKYTGDALINYQVAQAMRLPTTAATPQLITSRQWSLIIDAIFGTGLTTAPRDPFPALADAINQSNSPILAIDLPSGLDCDTGQAPGACIRATRTISFVAMKKGFANAASRQFTGQVHVGDIGVPPAALRPTLNGTGSTHIT